MSLSSSRSLLKPYIYIATSEISSQLIEDGSAQAVCDILKRLGLEYRTSVVNVAGLSSWKVEHLRTQVKDVRRLRGRWSTIQDRKLFFSLEDAEKSEKVAKRLWDHPEKSVLILPGEPSSRYDAIDRKRIKDAIERGLSVLAICGGAAWMCQHSFWGEGKKERTEIIPVNHTGPLVADPKTDHSKDPRYWPFFVELKQDREDLKQGRVMLLGGGYFSYDKQAFPNGQISTLGSYLPGQKYPVDYPRTSLIEESKTAAMLKVTLGKGTVVLSAPHPEMDKEYYNSRAEKQQGLPPGQKFWEKVSLQINQNENYANRTFRRLLNLSRKQASL